MAGCKSLNEDQVQAMVAQFQGNPRNLALFILSVKSGLRIGSLLSLTVGHVFRDGKMLEQVRVDREFMKGGKGFGKDGVQKSCVKSFTIRLHPDAQAALATIVEGLPPETPLFRSGSSAALGDQLRYTGWMKILKAAYKVIGFTGSKGQCATHSSRKTFANKIHKASGNDVNMTAKLLGHNDLRNVTRYLEVTQSQLDALVLGE